MLRSIFLITASGEAAMWSMNQAYHEYCCKSDYVISGRPIMGTETLAGQHHRYVMLWLITGLGCERSQFQIPRIPIISFLKVSVSDEIG